jgi:hypothetical protein
VTRQHLFGNQPRGAHRQRTHEFCSGAHGFARQLRVHGVRRDTTPRGVPRDRRFMVPLTGRQQRYYATEKRRQQGRSEQQFTHG